MNKKRIVSLFTVLVIMFSLLPATAMAAGPHLPTAPDPTYSGEASEKEIAAYNDVVSIVAGIPEGAKYSSATFRQIDKLLRGIKDPLAKNLGEFEKAIGLGKVRRNADAVRIFTNLIPKYTRAKDWNRLIAVHVRIGDIHTMNTADVKKARASYAAALAVEKAAGVPLSVETKSLIAGRVAALDRATAAESIQLTVGTTAQINKYELVGVNIAKSSFRSSSTRVAKVSSTGQITALKSGKATITFTIGKHSQKISVNVVAGQATPLPPTTATTTPPSLSSDDPYEAIRILNEERVERGGKALKPDDNLMAIAAIRAPEISVLYSHTRPDGSDPGGLFKQFGFDPRSRSLGEIASIDDFSAADVVADWINAGGEHARVALSPKYTKVGAARVYNPTYKTNSWVMVFAD